MLGLIGAVHRKSAAQVCLCFLVQHIVVITRTSEVERLSENAAIFDFTLSETEMEQIAARKSDTDALRGPPIVGRRIRLDQSLSEYPKL